MNATTNFIEDNNDPESDCDTNTDVAPEYYQPISPLADDDSDPEQANSDEDSRAENGIRCLHLNGDVEQQSSSSSSEEEEDEEEERVREASESAILRAFREDENRRNAPLSQENATRVIEAMRGISFSDYTPDWAGRVPQDQWIHRLRALRSQQQILSPNTSLHN
ncbi:uncharacterized protein LOC8286005 [Ricinus communis]|uniref:Uncharacterized protein n=1 Tax=Ricinus communis TaxID=3988 RepID=B9SK28_RICCO|nr:uncharacterized protein LOC8286005 [Ricinus communis]EEF36018.1 conserved hypothetical protein [Ricinus communis]|eukprot:XP_002526347.1 uncharacterized protein LOC8286005 [Ricinus communis]